MKFAERYGFERGDVTLANWRERPYSTWSFQHTSELVPSAVVGGGGGGSLGEGSVDAASVSLRLGGVQVSLADHLTASESDEILVMKGDKVALRWRAAYVAARRPHLIFSVSKSITGVLAGILADQGVLDTSKTVGHYLPSAANSGYGDCTIRNLLDMRASIAFVEEYLDDDGDYARYRRSTLWNPALPGRPVEGMEAMLTSLGKGAGDHGGIFHYLSPNSDMLGRVLEEASSALFADLMSDLLWRPLGCGDALVTVDQQGAPRTAGGVCAHADDLARLGHLLLRGGGGLVSEEWVSDMRTAGDSAAWAESTFRDFVPGGRYRSQWYQHPAPSQAFMAVGIHGQWIYADPERDVIIVRLASQSIPQADENDLVVIDVMKQIAAMV